MMSMSDIITAAQTKAMNGAEEVNKLKSENERLKQQVIGLIIDLRAATEKAQRLTKELKSLEAENLALRTELNNHGEEE